MLQGQSVPDPKVVQQHNLDIIRRDRDRDRDIGRKETDRIVGRVERHLGCTSGFGRVDWNII